ncbi:spore germination protein KA [Bacillus mesophilus]|uniref:Spore germination protein n=1 Tax=Bacillus mesophilus TaxID=1808955 RepID=A0A6M0QDR7_9BACI|nr:spore germination protein [Bacillus mesophilus]MBM7663191.1 spore germination protein KA [Bacillus mesophilus]NEY73969.1 spore germination protein [Bacillus mesophilus]
MINLTKLFSAQKPNQPTTSDELLSEGEEAKDLSSSLASNYETFKKTFQDSIDFTQSYIKVGGQNGFACYLDSMIDSKQLAEKIVEPLGNSIKEQENITDQASFNEFRETYFTSIPYEFVSKEHDAVWYLLSGYILLVVEGVNVALALKVFDIQFRGITEPSTQTIIRGPKDSFTESMETNVSLIRRRIKNPHLRFESSIIGKDSQTTVVIGYIDGITNSKLIEEIRKRINKIDTSYILDSGNIDEFITDKSLTVFPLLYNTERPDSACANLLEGKVIIIVDGSPFVLVAPVVFTDFFQSSEDYYQPFVMGSFIRFIRYISFMIALIFPSLYVAISTFHHELLPTPLLISVQAQREGVPFPAVVEILLMEFTFEVLREAGVRMPRAVGQTVSIVGALVIGQAAVEAGLVSNVLVIVVAFTAIASFVSPIYNFSISTRLLRFVVILCAAVFGLFGVLVFLVVMVIHLASLRSFGVAYLAPVAPLIMEDQTDVFIRFPTWANKKRPTYLNPKGPYRQKTNQSPSPPTKGEDS